MVGAVGFELTTPCTPCWPANQANQEHKAELPNHEADKIAAFLLGVPWLD
jgi:hypothetical protein